MKKIKNRTVRKVLRTIANWDTCPVDYKRDFVGEFLQAMVYAIIAFGGMGLFSILFILCN